jgi:hypothetical protein
MPPARIRKRRRKAKRNGQPAKYNHVSIPADGQAPIVQKALADIRPSPENDKLYHPINPNDPAIVTLAQSIRKHGLREPIVISLDSYILSGHRRYVACKLTGLTHVPCRVERIRRTDPEFIRLLREYNRQRVKTLDEITREEIVSANPEEAYRAIQEYRRQQACVDSATFVIKGEKRRAAISAAKEPFLNAIMTVLENQRDYWPLTDRRIHYALLNDPPLIHARKPGSRYRNVNACYKALCDLIARARLVGTIPFHAIHDPTRPVVTWRVHAEPGSFIRMQLDGFLKNYHRDLQQSQPNHIEIVGEKNTIESIIRPVAAEYCIPFTIGRGYCSLGPRYDLVQRFHASGKERLILLVLSDFDPEGQDIAHSFARSLRDDFGVEEIEPIQVALTQEQVLDMHLPPQMKAKESSSRYAKFTEEFGDDVFELEAVPPDRLQAILRGAIDGVLDIAAFNQEIDAEKRDVAYLDVVRRSMTRVMGDITMPDHMEGPR